jgi:hypothetical protein
MPRYSEADAREAVAASRSFAEAIRRLGLRPAGGNHALFKKYVELWGISTDHFDPYAASRGAKRGIPLEKVLVENSEYPRASLKRRLITEGLKQAICELCTQGEIWRGRKMALIIDHINGVPNDNRLENLRIVCPNCAATLDTHCGRKNAGVYEPQSCQRCGEEFVPRRSGHRYCSPYCGRRSRNHRGVAKPHLRRVERPPYEQLMTEIRATSYLAVGRKYGVSDNAIRKWVRQYERERAIAEGRDPDVIEIPTRTWPNRRREAA